MTPPSGTSLASNLRTLPNGTRAIVIFLLGLVIAFCVLLWPEWTQNPDLSHGFLAPVVFVLLLWESRAHGPQRWLPPSATVSVTLAVIVTLGFLLFGLAGLLAASVAWTHALVSFLLAASLCCFLLGGLLLLADQRSRVMPFNWISLTAIFLWLLVAPLPNGTYARITLALQGWVTSAVLHTLHLLGVPARQHGNILELATTSVGVEEACSGIRSLLSCLYAGFFFAGWLVRRPLGRLVLIVAAPLLALVMNFLRSLILTLLANSGKDITGTWHDATGYAILGLTAVILAGLAMALETKKETASTRTPFMATALHGAAPRIFWTAAGVTLALGVFYVSSFRPVRSAVQPVPDLTALLPEQSVGWEVNTSKNLYQFAGILQTTHLIERTYLRPDTHGKLIQLTVYIAYWPAGRTTVSRVASHTPDACWPGSGWINRPVADPREIPLLPGRPLPMAEHRVFQNEAGFPQNVWFWHLYDGRPINYQDPYSVPALLKLALQYGFRHQGDQFFIRVSSNQAWPELAGEPLVREIFNNLATTGL